MKKFKKGISIVLVVVFIFLRIGPYVAVAEDALGTPSPTETPTPTPSQSQDSQQQSENSNSDPTLTITPTPTPSPETSSTTVDNSAQVIDNISSTAQTGDNAVIASPVATDSADLAEQVATPSASASQDSNSNGETHRQDSGSSGDSGSSSPTNTPTPMPTSAIQTSDAYSSTEVVNSVNTLEVDSDVYFQTLNIFASSSAIDLSNSPLRVLNQVLNVDQNTQSEINVVLLDANNYAYVENSVVSAAISGSNSLEGNGSITTGDAISTVSLLNKINATIIGSRLHFVTINIYDVSLGDIILPDIPALALSGCCGAEVDIKNHAEVANNVDSTSSTGGNTIVITDPETATSSAEISTGSAYSAVGVYNLVNEVYIDVVFQRLFINVFGGWSGNFIGWGNFAPQVGGGSMNLVGVGYSNEGNDCPGCVDGASIQNSAFVTNSITSLASTGGNQSYGLSNSISTGNAFSSVSLFNIINSTLINSIGFIGFINIFGFLDGDIGGASEFEALAEKEAPVQNPTSEENHGGNERESGGYLTISQTNNVNDFVYPGDTVTFFVEIKNPGTGRVYDARWGLVLLDENGQSAGGGMVKLGDIAPGKGYKISTGLVLSKNARPGKYTAKAIVEGFVGPDNHLVEAASYSYFSIKSKYKSLSKVETAVASDLPSDGEVMGIVTEAGSKDTLLDKIINIFYILLTVYIPSKIYQRRRFVRDSLLTFGNFVESKAKLIATFFTTLIAMLHIR
jgi:hypothetical protein